MSLSSQGLTFSFASTSYVATSVNVDGGSERRFLSGAHLGLSGGAYEPLYRTFRTRDEFPTVSIEYIGASKPAVGTTGDLSISGPISFSGAATVTTSSITAAVGDLVRGSASFRVRPT